MTPWPFHPLAAPDSSAAHHHGRLLVRALTTYTVLVRACALLCTCRRGTRSRRRTTTHCRTRARPIAPVSRPSQASSLPDPRIRGPIRPSPRHLLGHPPPPPPQAVALPPGSARSSTLARSPLRPPRLQQISRRQPPPGVSLVRARESVPASHNPPPPATGSPYSHAGGALFARCRPRRRLPTTALAASHARPVRACRSDARSQGSRRDPRRPLSAPVGPCPAAHGPGGHGLSSASSPAARAPLSFHHHSVGVCPLLGLLLCRTHTASPNKTKRSPLKSRPSAPPPPLPPGQLHSTRTALVWSIILPVAHFLASRAGRAPSPERLRRFNEQMKRVSRLHRQHAHRAAPSESPSLTPSMADCDRQPWELALDNLSLVRRASIWSNDSTAPPRGRPESIHNFGKNLFHRRPKPKRGGGSRSSSASSAYSVDGPVDGAPAGVRDSLIPALFSRRKPSRDEPAAPRRLQISGPFNFQHVAHRQRRQHAHDTLSEFGSVSATDLHATQKAPLVYSSHGSPYDGLGLSTEPVEQHGGHAYASVALPPFAPRQTALLTGHLRFTKHARSREKLQKSPPRGPPRHLQSPAEHTTASPPLPIPPLRVSSRQSSYPDMHDVVASSASDYAETGDALCRPMHTVDDVASSPPLGSSRDATWPLPPAQGPYDMAPSPLPDVPEEEEQHGHSRRARLSLISNNSSLRGSQSVPMLRLLAKSQRPTSGASETLGWFGSSAPSRGENPEGQRWPGPESATFRESWEDVIDYCYEHEAEAHCDYEWGRPSLETARQDYSPPPQAGFMDGMATEPKLACFPHPPPVHLSPASRDMPALSPASQTSTSMDHEVVTPTCNAGVANNFSLPRGDRAGARHFDPRDGKRTSCASSFKESHGFHLSPSLLIPTDYQHQMLLAEAEMHAYADQEEYPASLHQTAFFEDVTQLNRNVDAGRQRSSTSTTATDSTSRSNSIRKRHMSTASSRTTLTRHTASSASLNKLAGSWTDESGPLPSVGLGDTKQAEMEHDPRLAATTRDVVPELVVFPATANTRKSHHRSHASESLASDEMSAPRRSPDMSRSRRRRARTTCTSNPTPPPVGQYALFPRTYVRGTGDQI